MADNRSLRNKPLIGLTMQNGWTNGSDQPRVVLVDGILHFTGLPSGGTTTIFTTLTTLPVGYRPTSTRYLTMFLDNTPTAWVLVPMRILTTGEVQPLINLPNNTGLTFYGSVRL